jgi:alginate O-acetyltransferase complex protein AlgI
LHQARDSAIRAGLPARVTDSGCSDFWQRWHMTLTRYLNNYLYNPVALARRRTAATASRFLSLVLLPASFTMLLAGIWRGAGAQFFVFGLLHAFYLVLNHAWRAWRSKRQRPLSGTVATILHVGGYGLTLLTVLIGQAFFRADSVNDATVLLAGMSGWHGVEPLQGLPWAGIDGALRAEDMLRLLIARWYQPLQIALLLLIV